MSDEAQTETPAQGDRPTGWFAFHEKPVMLQLREPYMPPTFGYEPTMSKEGVVAVPVLSGVLHVEPDGNGGTMLVLQKQIGDSDSLWITVKPEDVVYATHIHQARIVTQ